MAFEWTEKENKRNIIYAEDINSMAREVIRLEDDKANKSNSLFGYGIEDAYTTNESDEIFAKKSTTLNGYGIEDAYTKEECDGKFAFKETIYTKSEIDEKIKADITPTENSTNLITSGGVYEALKNAGGGGINEDITLTQKQLERLHYYGDKDIVPSDESLFVFSLTDDETGYSISANWDVNDESITDIVIPYEYNGVPVTNIAVEAFIEYRELTSVIIPESVTSIGEFAFYYCDSLTSINIPDSITSIEKYTFHNCDSLVSVTIPGSATSIGDNAFISCNSLTSINIPNSVTAIGDNAFAYCTNLTITCSQGSYAEQYAKNNDIKYAYDKIVQPDGTPTENSTNLITSGGVYTAIGDIESSLENIINKYGLGGEA